MFPVGDAMKRLIGFIFFWIAVGMAIMFFLPNEVLGILIIFVLLLLGYNLFCCLSLHLPVMDATVTL